MLIFDTGGNYLGRESPLPGFTEFRNTQKLAEFLHHHVRLPFRALYRVTEGNKAAQFEVVSRMALRARWLVYAVDEVDSFCNAGSLSSMDPRAFRALYPGLDPEADAALYQIANYSRNQFHIAFIFTSRYPAQVARGLTSQCSELRTFLITEPNHLDYLRQYYGADTERLAALPRFQFLRYRDGLPVELAGGAENN